MIDQATREYVQAIIETTPERAGSIDSVLTRGRRRRLTIRVGAVASVAAVAVFAVGMIAWLRPVPRPAASGADPVMLELPGGFAVGVEPDSVESEGATIYVGLQGPEPLFDTSGLGTEIALTQRSASDLIVPPSGDLLERNALQAAAMVYLGDIKGAQIALSVSDGGFLSLGGEQMCIFFGNGTPITGGGDCYVREGPKTGEGTDPPVGGWLVWTQLPEETAAVQMKLNDGTSYWQQPIARTVYFTLNDGRTLRDASLSAIDSDGAIIQTAAPEHTTPPASTSPPED